MCHDQKAFLNYYNRNPPREWELSLLESKLELPGQWTTLMWIKYIVTYVKFFSTEKACVGMYFNHMTIKY